MSAPEISTQDYLRIRSALTHEIHKGFISFSTQCVRQASKDGDYSETSKDAIIEWYHAWAEWQALDEHTQKRLLVSAARIMHLFRSIEMFRVEGGETLERETLAIEARPPDEWFTGEEPCPHGRVRGKCALCNPVTPSEGGTLAGLMQPEINDY